MLGWFSQRVFLGAAQRRLINGGWPVLNYHKISLAPRQSRDPFLYTKPESFDRQLALLRREGFQPANLDDLIAGPSSLAKRVVVTFDDAFLNVLENGLEPLRRHQVSAIQFVVADLIGQRNEWDVQKGDVAEKLMDAAQIKEWLAAGNEIGSHSSSHRNLKRLSPKEAREEIFGSKKKLEDRFGVEIRHFAYPFGGWTSAVRDLVAEAGYRSACSMMTGVNDASTDRFLLRRIIPYSSGEIFRKVAHRVARKAGLR